jgi:AcrR family transcriptional regulator
MDEPQSSENNERAQRILSAAERLIVHYGFDKTTVSDIAREAGVSKGAIYLHYASKESLFEALMTREIERYIDRWLELIEPDPDGGTFAGMYRHSLAALAEMPLMRALIGQDSRIIGTYMKRDNYRVFRQRRQFQERFVHAMQATGAMRADVDPPVVAYIFAMMTAGFLNIGETIAPEDTPPLEATLTVLGDMLDRWLGPVSEEGKAAGKQTLLAMVRAFREQMSDMGQG